MIRQLKASATLLVFLGALLCIPIVTKTLATHGALAAFVTALAVILLVVLGPLSFVIAEAIDMDFAVALATPSGAQKTILAATGVALLLYWLWIVNRGPKVPLPYIPVTGWAMLGAYFCVLQVFTHAT